MSNDHPPRGFQFALASPLLLAGWDLEACKREVAVTRRALLESEQRIDHLGRQRRELLQQSHAAIGHRLDLGLRDLQLRSLADLERRLTEARRLGDACRVRWTTAVAHCARKQQKVDGLNDIRTEQQAAFALDQSRQAARRADDDWLGRQRSATMDQGPA